MFEEYTFEIVQNFNYLSSDVNSSSDIHEKITRKSLTGNWTLYVTNNLFTLAYSPIKLICHCTVSPVVCYTAKAHDAQKVYVLEQKVIRRIIRSVKTGNYWICNSNAEIQEFLVREDIVRVTDVGRP